MEIHLKRDETLPIILLEFFHSNAFFLTFYYEGSEKDFKNIPLCAYIVNVLYASNLCVLIDVKLRKSLGPLFIINIWGN